VQVPARRGGVQGFMRALHICIHGGVQAFMRAVRRERRPV